MLSKGLMHRIYEEFLHIKKWTKNVNRGLKKVNIQMANKHIKGSQHH